MNIQDISLETLLSVLALVISVVSLYLSYKKYKLGDIHHKEILQFEITKHNDEKLKPYQDLYYNEFLKIKEILQNIPVLNDRIALLFHQYSKDKKEYLNHTYLDIESFILKTLGDEIWWQNIENLNSKISSVTSLGIGGYHMFSNIESDVLKLENLLDKTLYTKLELDYIDVFTEFGSYFKSVEEDLKIALEKYSNILHKAQKEEINFNYKLHREYQQIVNLLKFMLSLIGEINVNLYGTIKTLTQAIIIMGVKLRIIAELKEKVLNE